MTEIHNGVCEACGSDVAEEGESTFWSDHCSTCGACHDGVEIEWCEMGEHCEQCCTCENDEEPDD